MKRLFLIVLDSFGIGELPDAKDFNDEGSNTLLAVAHSKFFHAPILQKLGLFNIDGCNVAGTPIKSPIGAYCRLEEKSKGKDTTIGHWEISGLISSVPFPTYPNGFPEDVIDEFEKQSGYRTICNKPYSGTEVIKRYGKEHLETGSLIVYTSADSVFQIAAHEEKVPIQELYRVCEIARRILQGKHAVGRVIARPFNGEYPNYTRTKNRHDFSLLPPNDTMLDVLKRNKFDTIAIGKINDIFAGRGISEYVHTNNNEDGMAKIDYYAKKDFNGVCFANLVDFDTLYGHRNDIDGYAKAISKFDTWLGQFILKLGNEDYIILTADHGCDPSTPSTDHSREYIFSLIYGDKINPVNLGTRKTYADISATILDSFGIKSNLNGDSFWGEIYNE